MIGMTQTALDDLLGLLTTKALAREVPTRDEMSVLLTTSDDDVLDVVAAGSRVRRHFFGMRVKLNHLVNMKSGLCPEDCTYCSQRLGSTAEIMKYSWISPEEAAGNAERAIAAGAKRVCLVASGRGPSERDLDRVADTICAIKDAAPEIEVCACLGLLKAGQAERLREAGAHAYNHNLNTSAENYREICSTHTFDDRVQTVKEAQRAGLSPCSGAIFGMGESDEDIIDVALALRELDPDSVPVNFLIPFEGTPLGGHLANSMFLGDYLTSEGRPGEEDRSMIADAGFVIEGAAEQTLADHRHDLVTIRRRGAGTALPANT